MALTKISRNLLNTGVSDSSNATAITIDSSENVLIGTTSGSDPLVVSDSGASSITARFINTNADANPANIRLQKNSSSAADGDYLGMINVSGNNDVDTGEETIFQSIDFIATDVSGGTEDGVIAFRTRNAGTLAETLRISEQRFIKLPSKFAFSGTGDAGLGHHTNNYMYIYGGSAGLIHQDNSGGSNRILIRDSNSIEFEVNGSQQAQIDGSGNITKPNNCSFSARHGSTVSNFGINSYVQVPFDSEIYDNGGNLSSSGTFTAPVTGRYLLCATVRFGSVDASATYSRIVISTSNRAYQGTLLDHSVLLSGDADYHVYFAHFIADMDANDTANVNFYQLGGAAQADLAGDESFFQGELIG